MGQNRGLQNNFRGTYVQHCGSQPHPAQALTNTCQPQTAQSQLHMVHNSWPPKYNSPSCSLLCAGSLQFLEALVAVF